MKNFTRILTIPMLLAIGLTIAVSNANAAVTYDWVGTGCTGSPCTPVEGSVTLDDSVLIDNSFLASDGDFLAFDFTFGTFTYNLATIILNGQLLDLNFGTLSADQLTIETWFDGFLGIGYVEQGPGFTGLLLQHDSEMIIIETTGPSSSFELAVASGSWVRQGGGAVPEPATLAIFALGLAGLGAMRRRKAA